VYSLAPAIVGTVIETLLAVAIAGPLGIASALFISEVAPRWLREILKPGIEILAGIPSIVFGYLGLVVLNPYLSSSSAFGLPGLGSLLAVGLVVGVMALPTVVSVAEDAIASVPETMGRSLEEIEADLRENAIAGPDSETVESPASDGSN
jgi:phosphate transport system permease protein